MGLPSPPDLGSFDLSKTLGLQIPGTQNLNPNENAVPIIDRNLSPELARKIQNTVNENFNKHLPYYFAVCMANDQGVVTSQRVDQSILSQIGLNANIVTFNISPAQISVSNQFAINVSATNKGILEEHNGMIFRMIQISGTTGFLPQKANRNRKPSLALKVAQQLLPAASSAVVGLLQAPKSIAKAVIGGQDNDLNDLNYDLTQTGYYQFWQLNNFLIAYAEGKKLFKKGFDGTKLRLVFGSGKDNIGYVVTPVSFEMRRDVSNPLLYRYQIILKSWDVVSAIPLQEEVDADIPSPDSQSIIKSVTDVLTSSRKTIQAARNVLSGVHSDINSVFNIYNQALLVYQDIGGLISDVRTFGDIFVANRQSLLLNSDRNRQSIVDALNDPSERNPHTPQVSLADATVIPKSISLSAANSLVLRSVGFDATKASSQLTPAGEDKSDPEKKNISPEADTLVIKALSTDTFLDKTIDQLDIPDVVSQGIDDFRSQSQQLTSGQIQALASSLQQISDNYVSSIGAMDPVYSSTYHVPNPIVSVNRLPNEDDIIIAVALQESKQAFLSTLATGQFFLERDPDPFLSANTHLPDTDRLQTPNSSIAIPYQRGVTLDTLAQKYLGNAKRSRELIILNNLRSPYIDETGFTQSILGANGRTFIVTDISKLAIGQQITLKGGSAASTRRQILNIEDIGGREWKVTVDGVANLAMYIPSGNPTLFAHLPGTVGPGDMILIPSGAIPNDFAAIRPTSLFNRLSHAEQIFKVDIALDEINAQDISVSAVGDVQRSFGYNNAVQALRLALEVERGELDRHPSYGLPVPVGSRNSDINSVEAESMLRASITNDSRFVGADVSLQINGNVVQVNINAQGAAGTGQIPVTFEIGKE
jgi:hypothetical protein